MKNILVIHQSAELYGSDKMLLLLLKSMDKAKFYPVVVVPGEGPLKQELEKDNIKVVTAPVLKVYRKMFTPKNLYRFFKDIKKGVSLLDKLNVEYGFDLIYSNTLAVLLGMFYARKRKIKHVWHVHEIIVHPKIFAEAYPRLLNKTAHKVICNSLATRDNLLHRVSALQSKTVVVYNGLDESQRVGAVATKVDFGFTQEDIVITLVGRISRLKGHKWTVSAFSKYLKTSNAKLFFVGSPVPGQEYYETELRDIIKHEGLENKVTILPFTKNLKQIWDVTDIALMPSTEAESFGLVGLEAMLAKKPLVASNLGGLKEIVLNNETGYLVNPLDDKALADALIKLMDNPQLQNEFGESGYNRAKQQFSLQNYLKGINSVLEAES
ncbi:glycosyltransferase family 4 protein [Flavobacterium sp. C4GT6]|uniref:glycosyltransferase family 4 protein n=1 Tax=Flavobacterium sp. C4GT6 TaxID=3103818 RepID=UPI002ED1938C